MKRMLLITLLAISFPLAATQNHDGQDPDIGWHHPGYCFFGKCKPINIDPPIVPIEDDVPDPVPLPAAVWLFLSALVGIGVIGRRKK